MLLHNMPERQYLHPTLFSKHRQAFYTRRKRGKFIDVILQSQTSNTKHFLSCSITKRNMKASIWAIEISCLYTFIVYCNRKVLPEHSRYTQATAHAHNPHTHTCGVVWKPSMSFNRANITNESQPLYILYTTCIQSACSRIRNRNRIKMTSRLNEIPRIIYNNPNPAQNISCDASRVGENYLQWKWCYWLFMKYMYYIEW